MYITLKNITTIYDNFFSILIQWRRFWGFSATEYILKLIRLSHYLKKQTPAEKHHSASSHPLRLLPPCVTL